MKFDITRDGNKYIAEVKTLGWKLHWIDENACGVSPMLAFKEAMWMIGQFDEWANRSQEDFDAMLEGVRKMFDGEYFGLQLVGFANRPMIDIEPVMNGTEPPTKIHSMFVSVKETFDAERQRQTELITKLFTPGVPNRNGVVISEEAAKDAIEKFKASSDSRRMLNVSALRGEPSGTPVAMGHPYSIGIRANVTFEEDGKTIKSIDGPMTFNPIA
ncbi:hypothetical protein [Burkholderia phage FLC9]|nr:hypothetical protein [Burkholderia phage FLC9]